MEVSSVFCDVELIGYDIEGPESLDVKYLQNKSLVSACKKMRDISNQRSRMFDNAITKPKTFTYVLLPLYYLKTSCMREYLDEEDHICKFSSFLSECYKEFPVLWLTYFKLFAGKSKYFMEYCFKRFVCLFQHIDYEKITYNVLQSVMSIQLWLLESAKELLATEVDDVGVDKFSIPEMKIYEMLSIIYFSLYKPCVLGRKKDDEMKKIYIIITCLAIDTIFIYGTIRGVSLSFDVRNFDCIEMFSHANILLAGILRAGLKDDKISTLHRLLCFCAKNWMISNPGFTCPDDLEYYADNHFFVYYHMVRLCHVSCPSMLRDAQSEDTSSQEYFLGRALKCLPKGGEGINDIKVYTDLSKGTDRFDGLLFDELIAIRDSRKIPLHKLKWEDLDDKYSTPYSIEDKSQLLFDCEEKGPYNTVVCVAFQNIPSYNSLDIMEYILKFFENFADISFKDFINISLSDPLVMLRRLVDGLYVLFGRYKSDLDCPNLVKLVRLTVFCEKKLKIISRDEMLQLMGKLTNQIRLVSSALSESEQSNEEQRKEIKSKSVEIISLRGELLNTHDEHDKEVVLLKKNVEELRAQCCSKDGAIGSLLLVVEHLKLEAEGRLSSVKAWRDQALQEAHNTSLCLPQLVSPSSALSEKLRGSGSDSGKKDLDSGVQVLRDPGKSNASLASKTELATLRVVKVSEEQLQEQDIDAREEDLNSKEIKDNQLNEASGLREGDKSASLDAVASINTGNLMVNTGLAENNEVSQSSVVAHNSAEYEVFHDYGYDRSDCDGLSGFGESPDELCVPTLHGSNGSLLFSSGRLTLPDSGRSTLSGSGRSPLSDSVRSPLLGPDRR